MDEQNFSGERFLPEMNDAELEIEHLQRYHTVSRYVTDLDVLDAACGEGYGSSILAEKARSVVGIDIDAATVAAAGRKYSGRPNLCFHQGSVADLSIIESQSKDAVISFETIEHVSRELQEAFLKEIKRVLKPDGFLVMSTPDKKEYSDRYQFHNKFHVAEFYVPEFVAFLKQEFRNIRLYNQYLEVGAFIDTDHADREYVLFVKDSSRYSPRGKYVIAIAGNSALPEMNLGSVFMHRREEYLPILDELNYCRNEAITCRKKVEKLDECLNEQKLQKEELERRAVELDRRMDLINELRGKLDGCDNELRLQKEELERRAVELDKRMDLINELNRKCAEWDEKYNELQNMHSQKISECSSLQNEKKDMENKTFKELISWYFSSHRK